MRAAIYQQFRQPLSVQNVSDPVPPDDGVVIAVRATGICRSDWHGWMGHDPDIRVPHVPGHELAGVVAAKGKLVARWNVGDRITVPFVCACGVCRPCRSGNQQVCDHQLQPGFTHWGSFAEFVAIHRADLNLVHLPDELCIQVGLLLAEHSRPALPMDQVLSKELEIIGSHGMQAHRYPAMLEMIRTRQLQPEKLVGRTINLDESIRVLARLDRDPSPGVTIINAFQWHTSPPHELAHDKN